MRTLILLLLFPFVLLGTAHALAPHEIVLLVNQNSPESLAVANHYIDARKVPGRNVIYLRIPDNPGWLSPEQFSEHIEGPVLQTIVKRGLVGQALAWVYSAGFPFKVTTTPNTSVTGLPMARGNLPKGTSIKSGTWRSPIYSGPASKGAKRGESLSMVRLSAVLTTNMVPVCMSLGYSGKRGLTVQEINEMVDRSVASDYTKPEASVLLTTNKNVRSTCRRWIMETEPEFIRKTGREVELVAGSVEGEYSGFMGGATTYDLSKLTLTDGSIAEHLTSFAAAFDQTTQMKCSEWIRNGASATAGTVVEPYAIWMKFLNARVFEHQGNGCTALEAMALSTRSPLMTYFMGDPLSRPYMNKIEFEPEIKVDAEKKLVTISPNLPPNTPWVILVDGVLVSGRLDVPRVSLPFQQMSSGWHSLRIFAYASTPVRHYSERVSGFQVPGEREVLFSVDPELTPEGKLRCLLAAKGEPKNLRLTQGMKVIGEGKVVEVDPAMIGNGPVWLRAEADYEDNRMRVRSKPHRHVFEPVESDQ